MFQILAYINYWLRQVDAHSLHSPFLFDFYNALISSPFFYDEKIEALRRALKQNKTSIDLIDLGTGSRVKNSTQRAISTIAQHSTTPPKFSVFLEKMIAHYQLKTVVELGTSLGLNSLYMAKGAKEVITFECDPQLASLAQSHFNQFQFDYINLIQGDINETLSDALNGISPIDLAYVDVNHQCATILNYFQTLLPSMSSNGILVFNDIHWSGEMDKTWMAICNDERAILTIDLFEVGIVFLNTELQRDHLIIKF